MFYISSSKKFLPNFKVTFLIIGFTFILLPLMLFTKGLMISMAEFNCLKLF